MTLDCIYRYLVLGIFAASGLIFIFLLFLRAPYGRYYREGWGLTVSATAGWVIMESPAVFVIMLWFLAGLNSGGFNTVSVVFILMWELHYVQRTFIYPFQMRGGRKRFPLLIVAMAVFFNTAVGYLNGLWLFRLSDPYPVSWLYDIRFIAGAAMFFCGFLVNRNADRTLRSLRNTTDNGYAIPEGGLYNVISCPNYAGEILQWFGWAIATWSVAGLAFAVFTLANLLPRARSHHAWYRTRFPDYPQNRKRIIPFIY